MQQLAERQHDFALALLNGKLATPPGLAGPDGRPSPRRFGIYRNNVVAGLVDTLQENYPAVRRIVGDEFFRAMAAQFVTVHPPKSPIMLDYGAGFAQFIASFEPASSLLYLADVTRIERAWIEAYHAADQVPLNPQDLRNLGEDRLAFIRLTLHPSLRLVQSDFPVLTIWRMNVGDGVPVHVDLAAGGEDALIIRAGAEVEVHQLPLGGARFLKALAEGKPVVEASIAALEETPRFDLRGLLSGLIEAGAFTGWQASGEGRS